jgi:hypothetical protein
MVINRRFSVLPVFCAAALFCGSLSAEPNYNFAQVHYGHGSDGIDGGLGIAGSFRVHPNAYVFGEFSSYDNLDRVVLGGAWTTALDRVSSIDVGASWQMWDYGPVDSDDFEIFAGYRNRVTQQMTLRGQVSFYNRDLGDNDLVLAGGGIFDINNEISAFADLEYFTDGSFSIFRVGLRYNF